MPDERPAPGLMGDPYDTWDDNLAPIGRSSTETSALPANTNSALAQPLELRTVSRRYMGP